jgi:serine/threonine protein kinase
MMSKNKSQITLNRNIDPIRAQFLKLQKLGEGTYGDVFLALEKSSNRHVALKKMKSEFFEEGIPSTAMREISVLRELDHPCVVRYYVVLVPWLNFRLLDVIIHERNLWLVFEYIETDLKKCVH